MNYIINLTASNFSRQLDDVSALNLASVSGLFASFKNQNNNPNSEQTIRNVQINRPFSWQSIDLFLGLFSGFGRCLIGKSTTLSNLFKYVTILWSMNVSSLTYFVRRFLFLIATLLEKTNFAKSCLL